MDYINALNTAYEKGSEIFSDYQRGKQVRLGQYKGVENVKQIGHYNSKTGKRLAIYHG